MSKPSVNIVGKTIDQWIFRRMVEEIAKTGLFDVSATAEPLPRADLYHWFRPQDAELTLRRGWNGRFVTTLHGVLPGATDFETNREAYARAQAVVAVWREGKKYLTSYGIASDRVKVIHAGANPERFFRAGWPEGHFTVGLVSRYYGVHGRVEDNKGAATVLGVMRILAGRRTEAMLLVAGTGWRRPAQELSTIPVPVLYYERGRNCAYADYPRLYNAMDCLLIASKFEGGPVAAYEAMMCGRPLVSTAVGVVPELVAEGRTGHIFAQGDAEACAELLLKLRDERDEWRRERWRGPAARVRGFTWERWRRLHEELYQAALDGEKAR